VLGTTVINALMRGDKHIEQHLNQADEVFTPSIALGELFFGAHNSTQQ
jgi:predicted nucleic acid-binding protein